MKNSASSSDDERRNTRFELSLQEPTTSTDDDSLLVDSQDMILRELFWYVCKGKETTTEHNADDDGGEDDTCSSPLRVGDCIASLAREGLLFWCDERFLESQNAALSLARLERSSPYSKQVAVAAQQEAEAVPMDYAVFLRLVSPCAALFLQAFSEELVIPDWSTFVTDMTYLYHKTTQRTDGENAQYIPILKDADSDKWGLSICSIDGQRFSIGDSASKYTLQSVSKPITYAMGLKTEGEKFMEEWVDVEPAGRPFNTQDLEPDTCRPFNASVNSGAILTAGVVASRFPDYSARQVVDHIRATWLQLCGNYLEVGFSEDTFQSEKETAYNNFAIAYNLKGRKGLPRDVDLHKMLDVYLGCCSLEITTDALSVAAATLANGGKCPITGKEVFPADVVRSVLAETMTCGMYNQAGHFAVEVGLPAKSGVSGALMVIVPNVFGFATFSPRLNAKGNSVRGIEFCKRLVRSYRVHIFEPLRSGHTGAKLDPRRNGMKEERNEISRMAWAVQVGDKYAVRLRDIFLFALCQTAVASPEGLSERMLEVIRESYQQIYQNAVDEKLFADIQKAVQQHPNELRFLEELTREVDITDSMRSLIIMAMLDIIMIDDLVGEVERTVASQIAELLGIESDVALMELNRYERHAGHRFKEFDYCNMIDTFNAEVSHRRSASGLNSSRHGGSKTMASIRAELLQTNVDVSNGGNRVAAAIHSKVKSSGKHIKSRQVPAAFDSAGASDQEEVLMLRMEVLRLRGKVGALTHLLQERDGFVENEEVD